MLKSIEERAVRQATMRETMSARREVEQAFERHYTVHELAKQWNVSYGTARHLVMQDAGVCKIGLPGKRKSYRVAESVARRIYARLLAGAQ